MSSSMYKSDYCDPKKNHQLCQLLEEGESSINCVRQIAKAPSLCQRHKPSKRPSSGSEIDISLLRNNPIGFNVAADKKTSYFSITNPSCNSCEPCIKSKSEYKLLSRPTTSFEGKIVYHQVPVGNASQGHECYESRMFQFPYISQISPRLPPARSSRPSKNTTEYQDKINKIGSLIMKHQLHDHKKCGAQGRHCEHLLLELNHKLKTN